MKDFYDLWVLAVQFEFDGRKLQEAIVRTFQQRNTVIPKETPVGLSNAFAAEKQSQWQAFLKRTRIDTEPETFLEVIQILNTFLIPLLQASAKGEWIAAIWKPGGPWRSLFDEG